MLLASPGIDINHIQETPAKRSATSISIWMLDFRTVEALLRREDLNLNSGIGPLGSAIYAYEDMLVSRRLSGPLGVMSDPPSWGASDFGIDEPKIDEHEDDLIDFFHPALSWPWKKKYKKEISLMPSSRSPTAMFGLNETMLSHVDPRLHRIWQYEDRSQRTAMKDFLRMANLMLEKREDIHINALRDFKGGAQNYLHYSARRGHSKLVEALLKYRFQDLQLSMRDYEGKTALQLAEERCEHLRKKKTLEKSERRHLAGWPPFDDDAIKDCESIRQMLANAAAMRNVCASKFESNYSPAYSTTPQRYQPRRQAQMVGRGGWACVVV
ncbi:hypothetical protein ABW21_db0207281 [Orbilia brochopaga]|nr:hypothetical protein ABW21_db0207281 [Drechslerella brochopaga]